MTKMRAMGSKIIVRNGIPRVLTANTGVLNNHINTTILNKIQGKNPATSKRLYTTQNPWTPQFVRNPDCWLNGVSNISCISPAQLSGANWFQRAGTLISPRHIILAKHYTIALLAGGTDIRFVADDNTVVTRKLISLAVDPNSDIAVYLLDSDVPSNIKFAKALHPGHYMYLGSWSQIRYAVFLDQEEKASIGINTFLPYKQQPPGIQDVVYVTNPSQIYSEPGKTQASLIAPFYETPISGDSGNPMFLLIDNELVIISCWTTPLSGSSYPSRYRVINSLMTQLGGGYNLTPIDLHAVYNKYK